MWRESSGTWWGGKGFQVDGGEDLPVHGGEKKVFRHIRYFPMLVATGSFSPERGLTVNFDVDFNHFQSIVMSALIHSKSLKCSFLNNFRLLFHMLPTKI